MDQILIPTCPPRHPHPWRQQKSLARGQTYYKKKQIADDFPSVLSKSSRKVPFPCIVYCLKGLFFFKRNHELYSSRFPEGVQKEQI